MKRDANRGRAGRRRDARLGSLAPAVLARYYGMPCSTPYSVILNALTGRSRSRGTGLVP
jgi:hypothetical protein